MAQNSILRGCYPNLCSLVIIIVFSTITICFHGQCFSHDQVQGGRYNSFTVSSFSYSNTQLKPYEWRYIRVDLPPWFSTMSVVFESDVYPDPESLKNVPTARLPMICLREGGPPLPDAYTGLVPVPISNGSFGDMQGLQNTETCYPMQKNMSVKLTNEQISPGIWYWGLFNGIGPTRTQSKMINRGPSFSFSGNLSVEGCIAPMLWGQYCNQTFDLLSCTDSYNSTENLSDPKLYNQTAENVISCTNSVESSCHRDSGLKLYSLDIMGIAEQLTIMAMDVRFNETASSNHSGNGSKIILMCYARHGAIPLTTLHDYSANITEDPLVIRLPKVGRWFIAIHLVNRSNEIGGVHDMNVNVCYSLDWQVLQCPEERAGLNCTWKRYMLQTVLRKNPSTPFESYYLPMSGRILADSANFLLEPLLSHSSYEGKVDIAWTYFLMEIPYGAGGSNLHIQLTSDAKIKYEIYAKHGGLPSLDSWDYFYTNTTSNSNGSMLYKLYDSGDKMVSFYILYVRGGTWSIGFRHLNPSDSASKSQTTMSISLERCPKRCSSHGTCQSVLDTSGLALYSYCSCDRDHGGFDCSVEIVSHQGHVWQSIALIASNAAAVLPAYWSLRHKFMDFWLSFMAVVSTFIYLVEIDEASKRTIHTVVAIITALMAVTGPTRSANIALVISIGALGLLIGWLIEFCTKYRSLPISMEFCLNIHDRWKTIKLWLHNLVQTLLKRFRWGFVLAGFTTLGMAAISWTLESNENYWIWHSMWHISIYTSSFLFLCSKAIIVDGENQTPPDGTYELTRQDSFSRGEIERY